MLACSKEPACFLSFDRTLFSSASELTPRDRWILVPAVGKIETFLYFSLGTATQKHTFLMTSCGRDRDLSELKHAVAMHAP